jgi:hypothetical protein
MEYFKIRPDGDDRASKVLLFVEADEAADEERQIAGDILRFQDEVEAPRTLGGPWVKPVLKLVDEDDAYTDFPHAGFGIHCVSELAAAIIQPFLRQDAELLPVTIVNTDEVFYWLYANPRTDVLDHEKSDIKFFRSGGIMTIKKHEFFADKLIDVDIFGPRERHSRPFLSARVVNALMDAKVRGVSFKSVWKREP